MQIQYPAYTQPPVGAPTVTIPEFGWRKQYPDSTDLEPRGRYRRQHLQTANQTTGVDVFAVEQLATPGRFIGVEYRLNNPHHFINRRYYRARGGGYLNTPWVFHGLNPENYPLGTKLAPNSVEPDLVWASRLRTGAMPSFFPDPSTPTGEVPVTDWMSEWPDRVPSRLKSFAGMPAWVTDTTTPAEVAAVTDWMVAWPDLIPRRLTSYAEMPAFVTDPTTPVATVVSDWMVELPDRPGRRPLSFATMPSITYGQPLDAILLRWSVVAPVGTRRRVLTTGQYPASVAGQPLDAILLRWSVVAPSSTTRRSLATAHLPSVAVRPDPVAVAFTDINWCVVGPSSTTRRSLSASNMPASVRQDPIFAATIAINWWVVAPSTTRRAVLATGQLPTLSRDPGVVIITVPEFVRPQYPLTLLRKVNVAVWMPASMWNPVDPTIFGAVLLRRYDDQTDRVGSRSVTGRISQL